jgi:uncharacterized protein YndB with AHSA1/START domain
MLATIEKQLTGYTVTYERHFEHPLQNVWNMLTDNNNLALWFDELRVVELSQGGYLNFNMGDGTFIKMEITAYQKYAILEFTWGEDLVRFELSEEEKGCKLVLIEELTKITEHTPKDLAGWHVCLDVIDLLLNQREIDNRMKKWKYWFEKYKEALKAL